MATYYVDGSNGNDSAAGSASQPWKTLGKASRTVKSGDEVRVRAGTYHEQLVINTANTRWIADSGQKPILDGRYHDGLTLANGNMPSPTSPGNNFLPVNTTGFASLVEIKAEGVVFDGFTVRNSAGAGISPQGSRSVVRNCRVDHCWSWTIRGTPPPYGEGIVVENNVLTRSSRRGRGANVNMQNTRDFILRNNVIAFSTGEGVVINDRCVRTIVENNVIHTTRGVILYDEFGTETVLRGNLIFHLGLREYSGKTGGVSDGIILAWETASPSKPQRTAGAVYNNIVVNTRTLFRVRNNDRTDSQLDGHYIGHNTFVGGPQTQEGIVIQGNLFGNQHRNTLFENNLILCDARSQTTGDARGVAFRNNLWSTPPPATMRGAGDRIGNPNLADPLAPIKGRPVPDPATDVDPRNYQLTARSALAINAASDGSRINNVTPPAIPRDFFGAGRQGNPDIGAHEFAGVAAAISANFNIGPGQDVGVVPHTVDFIDRSTAARPIVSWSWEFGDGGTSTERNPSHTYQAAGEYDVKLTVQDDAGNRDSLTQRGLITARTPEELTIPSAFRRFLLLEGQAMNPVAFGTQYPDLRCILLWNDDPFHVINYDDIEDVTNHAGDPDQTAVFWLDENRTVQ